MPHPPLYPGETPFNRWDYWQKIAYCQQHGIKPRPRTLTEHERKDLARKRSAKAIKAGVLVRPDACQRCGESLRMIQRNGCAPAASIDCHHRNYDDYLDVEWLCRPCHRGRHAKQRRSPTR
jgi:hypothetical protein